MRASAQSKYGKQYNFAALSTVEMLRDQHPITDLDDYRDVVNAVAGGDISALFGPQVGIKQLTELPNPLGAARMVVTTEDQSRAQYLYGSMVAFDTLCNWIPTVFQPQRTLRLMHKPALRQADGSGIRIGPLASSPEDVQSTAALYSTPMEAYECTDQRDTLYLHVLFALRDRDLGQIECDAASGVLDALTVLDDPRMRLSLVGDIAKGAISREFTQTLPSGARGALASSMTADRERAAEVLRALLEHDARGKMVQNVQDSSDSMKNLGGKDDSLGGGTDSESGRNDGARAQGWSTSGSLVQDLWPKLRCVHVSDVRQYKPSKEELRRKYLPPAGVVPIYTSTHTSIAGLVGVNIAPFDDAVPPPKGRRAFFVEALRDGMRDAGAVAKQTAPLGPPPPRPQPWSSDMSAETPVPQGDGEEERQALKSLSPQEAEMAARLLPLGGGTLPSENAFLLHPRAMVFELLPHSSGTAERDSSSAGVKSRMSSQSDSAS